MSDSTDAGEESPADAESPIEPAEVFSLLGDEVRLEIVATLGERDTDQRPLPFSALHDRVELEDSGQFNYHLSQLVPHFVAKTDEGYRLTSAGGRVARAVAAGLYTDSPTIEPFAIDGECYRCGVAACEASYHDERFHVRCTACDERLLRVEAPPSLVRGRSPTEALAAFERWSGAGVEMARQGICPECGGPLDSSVTTDTPGSVPLEITPRFDCRVCGRSVVTAFGALANDLPTVEGFHERHGVDTSEEHYWEIDQFCCDEYITVLSESPWRVQVAFPAGEEVCRVVFDDSLEVVRTEIVRAPEGGDDPASDGC